MFSNNKRVNVLVKLLEKYSGKKVSLKEADETVKNQAVELLQAIQTSLSAVQDNVSELYDIPIMNKQRNVLINKLHSGIGKLSEEVDYLISNITEVTSEEQLEEDVTMSSDDIIKNPNTVKKLNDRKIDVRVKDDNSSTNRSTTSSSNISMSSASF